MFEPLCEKKHIALTIKDDKKDIRDIYVDKLRFNQICFNLLSNAVKYTPEYGHVEFFMGDRLIKDGKMYITLRIKDDGIGMSEEFQQHLYEAFEQENHESATSGSGLGLSIVKRLVELMEGTITLKSVQGEGTEFCVYLPLTICEVKENNVEKAEKKKVFDFNDKRVLLCEDHPLNIEIMTKILRKKGMQIEVAENGQKGVELFANSPIGSFDIILMDIRMPVMDGLEATKAIRSLAREDAQTIPIIAMTANAFQEDREKSQQAGMNEHLAKPIDPQKLFDTLERYLSNWAEELSVPV